MLPLDPGRRSIFGSWSYRQPSKEILGEIFHTRPSDVEDMINKRLEEKSCSKEIWHEEERCCGLQASVWGSNE
jgi:hypothetical protein